MSRTSKTKLYMIVLVNDRTGKRTDMFDYPMSHEKMVTIKSKMTPSREKHLRYVFEARSSVGKRKNLLPRTRRFVELKDRYWNLPKPEMRQRHKAAKLQLRFLPYLTPEFPEDQGRVEVPLNTRAEAMEIFEMLRERDLIEDATLHYADGHTETLL
jgi:hypothetical protein